MPGSSSPETNVIQFRAAEQLVEAHDPRGAITLLDSVLEEYPDHAGARLLRARAYFLQARLTSAEAEFGWVLEREPDNAFAHFAMGRTLKRADRPEEAKKHFKIAAALNPRPDFVEAAGFDTFEPPPPGTPLGN